jgi:hypothetical protein
MVRSSGSGAVRATWPIDVYTSKRRVSSARRQLGISIFCEKCSAQPSSKSIGTNQVASCPCSTSTGNLLLKGGSDTVCIANRGLMVPTRQPKLVTRTGRAPRFTTRIITNSGKGSQPPRSTIMRWPTRRRSRARPCARASERETATALTVPAAENQGAKVLTNRHVVCGRPRNVSSAMGANVGGNRCAALTLASKKACASASG